ncbi:hypothetical protein HDU84_007256, partial [Entophlyctis sp. JEL0112]
MSIFTDWCDGNTFNVKVTCLGGTCGTYTDMLKSFVNLTGDHCWGPTDNQFWCSVVASCPSTSDIQAIGICGQEDGTSCPAAQTVVIDPSYQHTAFEGWGTSLAWFAVVTGGYSDEVRNKIVDLVFGADGLALNIARYNVGGGNAPSVKDYLRPGGAVPGWWAVPGSLGLLTPSDKDWWDPANPAHWNETADPHQRWFVDQIKDRITHWEAFANSPAWFHTVSGYVSGGFDATAEQIRNDTLPQYADYLVGAVERLEQAHGIQFTSIEPLNEPNTNFYYTTLTNGTPTYNRQEGAHAGPAMQGRVVTALSSRLANASTKAFVSAPDETNPETLLSDWYSYNESQQALFRRINVHTYATADRTVVRDIAKGWNKKLWMSEVEGSWATNFTDIHSALGIGQHIIDDIRELEPEAWVLWQPIEDYYDMIEEGYLQWGSYHIPMNCTATDTLDTCPIRANTKSYGIRHFTNYIRPGDRFIKSSDTASIGAIRQDGTIVVVNINSNPKVHKFGLDLTGFDSVDCEGATITQITSTVGNFLVSAEPVEFDGLSVNVTVPPLSISTFLVTGITGVNASKAHIVDGGIYNIIGKQSTKSVTPSKDNTTAIISTNSSSILEQWKIQKRIAGLYDSNAVYTIQNMATGQWLAGLSSGENTFAGSVVFQNTSDGSSAGWLFSTSGDGWYTIINEGVKVALDVSGASTSDGATIDLWQAN